MPANEFTPLLPAEENGPDDREPRSFPDATAQHESQGARNANGPTLTLQNRPSVDEGFSSAIADDYDGEELTRHRSRLSSYPVLPEVRAKKEGVQVSTVEDTEQNGSQTQQTDGEDSDSKYMRVGAVRFWFVFLTVLLGMFSIGSHTDWW